MLKYLDKDGDLVTMTSRSDVQNALAEVVALINPKALPNVQVPPIRVQLVPVQSEVSQAADTCLHGCGVLWLKGSSTLELLCETQYLLPTPLDRGLVPCATAACCVMCDDVAAAHMLPTSLLKHLVILSKPTMADTNPSCC